MKRVYVLVLPLVLLLCFPLFCSAPSYGVEVDWQMSIQGSITQPLNEYLSLKAGLGISLMGVAATEAYVILDTHLLKEPWGANVLLGIPNFLFPLTFDAAMFSLGGAVEFKHSLSPSLDITLRLGAGFPLFFEEGKDLVRDIAFPLNLWPEAALGLAFHRPLEAAK